MSEYVFKLPDLGEGTVEAEIVRWHVRLGDLVAEDQAVVELMTDKAAVEVPAPVSGRVTRLTGEPGDKVAVGSPLVVFALDGGSPLGSESAPAAAPTPAPTSAPAPIAMPSSEAARTGRVMASPATRRLAREAGIDLSGVSGSGPGGRILRGDLPAAPSATPSAAAQPDEGTTEIKVLGVRRLIAARMSEAKRTIPHFSYVEEADVTELEALRAHLNATVFKGQPPLTYMPFVIAALARVLPQFPQCNVRYDASRDVLVRHRAVHVGIATQTPDGLKVPVLRHAESLSLEAIAAAVRRLSERARANQSTREELSGSTITVTSLGKLGGIASTPVINSPEVAIVGLNKAVERPVVREGSITVRRIMNLSSSFDHRFVDGYDAAAMIQALKESLEHPAMIFLPKVQFT